MGCRALLSAVYCLDSHALDSSVAKRFQSSEMVARLQLTHGIPAFIGLGWVVNSSTGFNTVRLGDPADRGSGGLMPKRRSKRAIAQCRAIRDAFRRAAARGIFTEDDARALMAGKIGFSAEELAKLLSESEAVRRRTGNTEALESQSSSVERHGLQPTLNQQPNADAQAAVAAARPSEVDTVVSC